MKESSAEKDINTPRSSLKSKEDLDYEIGESFQVVRFEQDELNEVEKVEEP